MTQFFKWEGKWLTMEQMKKVAAKRKRWCQFCDAKGPINHKKDCPIYIEQHKKGAQKITDQAILEAEINNYNKNDDESNQQNNVG